MISFLLKWGRELRQRRLLRPIRAYIDIDGFLTEGEALALFHTARELPEGALCCEIGAWKGRSAYCLASGLSTGSKLTVIDPFDASGEPQSAGIYARSAGDKSLYDQFWENMRRLGVADRIEVLCGYSNAMSEHVGELDLLFIDGDHSVQGCSQDFLRYGPKLKLGGYLLFHDYDSKRKDLGPVAVIETLVYPAQEFEYLRIVDSLWIGRRIFSTTNPSVADRADLRA